MILIRFTVKQKLIKKNQTKQNHNKKKPVKRPEKQTVRVDITGNDDEEEEEEEEEEDDDDDDAFVGGAVFLML